MNMRHPDEGGTETVAPFRCFFVQKAEQAAIGEQMFGFGYTF